MCVHPCGGRRCTKGSRLRDWGNEESALVLPACRAKEMAAVPSTYITTQTGVEPQWKIQGASETAARASPAAWGPAQNSRVSVF